MVNLTKDRLWCLNWWRDGEWTLGRPMSRGVKKWEHHIDMLVKAGLLECDYHGGVGPKMCRITPAGRLSLSQGEGE